MNTKWLGQHARDVADHKKWRDLGYAHEAEENVSGRGSNHSCARSESNELAGDRAD